ncbi:Ig-like domain-containing protein [Nonomuraea fuscirosea]|uniref:Ig-like domain-containing protein n=1 Tax=Nonomuraea fuscirosea TaxID=1291556 RepID=UPI002DD92BA3|nr:Ig-like domain-containing protein [Nonomuraea fuscirosea]WSA48883.1 Ig-like domain-containing protein [Nonomuraea fuscirosea]
MAGIPGEARAEPALAGSPTPTPAPSAQAKKIPAFPGAEGAGMYTTGGRGGAVYEVTTLDDDGPGSLRAACAKSDGTIVFRVAGTIKLKGGLDVTGSNLTIAGQTAPGHGITVTGNETQIKGDNIILRHLRFRGGDELGTPIDTFGARGVRDLVIDHCSFSWGVDECCSVYGNTNVTVQWCVISEGLTNSVHDKGRHGMGGLWGGDTITYHHNLLVHQNARNPRFSFEEGMALLVDHRNNVIYNPGITSCYGGEWSNGINLVGNYYKPGPNTLPKIAREIVAPGRFGQWHVTGNEIAGHADVTADNTLGITYPIGGVTLLPQPVEFANGITEQTARQAYAAVLDQAGATLPRRDAIDARLVNEARTGTGRHINSQKDVGGFLPLPSEVAAPADTDKDGIPDEWETAQGLNPDDAADAQAVGPDGYTNLERYLNTIQRAGAPNPEVAITSPTIDQVFAANKDKQQVTVTAEARAAEGASIARVEFFHGDEKIGEAAAAPYQATWQGVTDGTYFLTARATDNTGSATTSSLVPIHVNRTRTHTGWQVKDVGEVPIPGNTALKDGVFTIKGSGKIAGWNDSFHFAHKAVGFSKRGEVLEITARVDDVSRNHVDAVAGIMIRQDLEPNSPFMMAGIGYAASNEDGSRRRAKAIRVASHGTAPSVGVFPPAGDDPLDDKPYWLRLVCRSLPTGGDTEFEAFLSDNSLNWDRIGYERIVMRTGRFYVGLAVDGNQEANGVHVYTTATFRQVKVNR